LLQGETIEACVSRLVLEYAEVPPALPVNPALSLRADLAIESLSLVSLALRLGDELDVNVVEMELELGTLVTIEDLVKVGYLMQSRAQGQSTTNEGE
jgi:acyl carrier protein